MKTTFIGALQNLDNPSLKANAIMNVTQTDISKYLGESSRGNVIPANSKVLKRCPSQAKARPPLTDRTNILSHKHIQVQ